MTKQIILLTVTILAAVSFTNAQPEMLAEDSFWTQEMLSSKRTEKMWRRETTKTEFFNSDGTISGSITETKEVIPASENRVYRERIVIVEKHGSEEKIREEIRIGEDYYLVKGERQKPVSLQSGGADIERKYGLEPKSCRLYTLERDVLRSGSPTKLSLLEIYNDYSKGFRFNNYIIQYDSSLTFMRKERVKGRLDPRTVESREITTYEYDVIGLKIEAPVK